MKILIVANGYPNKREPQWGCFERDQALALKELGHEVSILYVDRRFRTYWRKIGISRTQNDGLRIYGIYYCPEKFLRIFLPFRFYNKHIVQKMYDRVYRSYIIHEGKPDVIYAHYLYNIYYATTLQEKYNIPLVGIEHWSELTKVYLPPLLQYWGETAYTKADKILAVSESLRSQIKRHFDKDSIVVYDMLGQEFVSSIVTKTAKTGKFRFVSVGSLLPIKCFDLLLEAFAAFYESHPESELIIVGDGTERKTLQSKINDLQLTGMAKLVGRKNKQDIIDYLNNSHVYVLSSQNETFGVACIEGLSMGLPCIVTQCGGPEEFINEKNGILVPTKSVEALSEAMNTIYNNYEKYDRVTIAEECRHRFAPQVIAKQLTTIFETVVNK